jgi:hypothetical protein
MTDKSKLMDSLSKNLPEKPQPKEVAIPEANRDIKDDYEYSRETYRNLIDQGQESLLGMMQLAAESEHPRAYEVLSTMMKNMADMTDKLMELQKKKKDLTQEEQAAEAKQTLTQNNVFVGTTTELQRMLLEGTEDIIDVETSSDK